MSPIRTTPASRALALAAALGLGIACARAQALSWTATGLCALGSLLFAAHRRLRAPALVFALGIGWGAATLVVQAARLETDPSWRAHPWTVTARVVRGEARTGYARLWLADVVRADGARLPGLARVSARRPVAHGARIRARVRFRRCLPRRNPGAWDFAAWCRARGIALVGSVRGPVRVLAPPDALGRLRARLRGAWRAAPEDARPWLFALVLGERGLWRADVLDRFGAAGIAHLLAISGLHVGMVGAAGAFLAALLARLAVPLLAWAPARVWGMAAGVPLAWGYVGLAGWPVSGVRAALVLSIAALSWALGRTAAGVHALALAFALLALVSPSATESVGFWLSFAGALALVLLPRAPGGWRRRLGLAVAAAFVAHAATMPWTVARFGWLAPYAVPANLAAGLLFPPLLASALASAAGALLGWDALAHASIAAAGWFGRRLVDVASLAASSPGGMLVGHAPGGAALALVALLLLAAAALLARGRMAAALMLALAAQLGLSARALAVRGPPDSALWAWDVGQGAASALPVREGGVLLVDAPGRWGAQVTGGHLAAEAMRALGLMHADLLAITHAQSDHGGGAPALIRRLRGLGALALPDVPGVRRRWFVRAAAAEARRKGARVLLLGRGDRLALPGIAIEVLWPPHGARLSGNAACLVLRVRAGGRTLLFPGDIPARVERRLLADLAPVDVALAPHHGSRTSSSPAFVRRLRPRFVVVQTGRGNRWGFPHPEVVARWRAAGARVLDTKDGAVRVRLAPGPLAAAHWHAPPDAKARRALRVLRRFLESAGRTGGGGGDAPVHRTGRDGHVCDPGRLRAGAHDHLRAGLQPAARARDPGSGSGGDRARRARGGRAGGARAGAGQ